MSNISENLQQILDTLFIRYPNLRCTKGDIERAYLLMEHCYEHDGKLLIAGNGGSAADCEHIAGELMKKFRLNRPISGELSDKMKAIDETSGEKLSNNLEMGLMAIPLVAHEALTTAYINDVDGNGVFAQQLLGFGRNGDVFLGITTSGNSKNIYDAAIVAKAIGMSIIILTGKNETKLTQLADVSIHVPEKETYLVQEMHLPIYHCLCMMLEEKFFG